jgi:hypothetical protein
MLRILAYLIGILLVVAVGVVGYAALQPDAFRYERSAVIAAPPEKIITIITDFRRNGEWSPWEKLDPGMKRTYSGAPSGVGAIYEWDGNDDVGAGRQEIVSVDPNRVHMKVAFLRPMQANNNIDFDLAPEGDTTKVTWSLNGENPLITKVFDLFLDIDGMVGKDFETGLASLKAAAEKAQ